MASSSLPLLMQRLNYVFQQPEWLLQALTHRSFGVPNNERLEFIGDSILNYSIARMLFDRFPDQSEGSLSRLRANLVNQDTLAQVALDIGISGVLRLGEGEMKSGGAQRPSILADALEAIFAAVCLDADFAQAEHVVRHLFVEQVNALNPEGHVKDAKTRLQEWLQSRRLALPSYRIIEQSGEAHAQHFRVSCELPVLTVVAEGSGSSRRRAEQQAAEAVLAILAQPSPSKKRKVKP